MGVHVDDKNLYIKKLRGRFPYGKWRARSGEFCGDWYDQKPDKSIVTSMSVFADRIPRLNVPKNSASHHPLSPGQIKVLRAVNGSLKRRPDLSAQTSRSQQSFPQLSIEDCRMANQAIKRACQHRNLGITFKQDLSNVCHSDAAFANREAIMPKQVASLASHVRTCSGREAPWAPLAWQSYRLWRAVDSMVGAESQATSVPTGTIEWVLFLLAEICDGARQI